VGGGAAPPQLLLSSRLMETNLKHRLTGPVGLGIAVTALGLGLLYLGSRAYPERAISSHGVSAAPAGVLLVLGFDRSGSYRSCLGGAVAQGCGLAATLDHDTDGVACYAMDTKATELYDNPPPESGEELAGIVAGQLRCVPATRGTNPASFWEAAVDRLQDVRVPAAAALYSDADNDSGPGSMSRIRAAAKRLALNKNVVFVAVYGVDPDNRAAMESAFAPLGRDRFRLYGPQEADTDTLLSRLQQSRTR
jgi:hypothetical protein